MLMITLGRLDSRPDTRLSKMVMLRSARRSSSRACAAPLVAPPLDPWPKRTGAKSCRLKSLALLPRLHLPPVRQQLSHASGHGHAQQRGADAEHRLRHLAGPGPTGTGDSAVGTPGRLPAHRHLAGLRQRARSGAGCARLGPRPGGSVRHHEARGRDHGAGEAASGFRRSLANLDLGYVDLYLVHWPGHGQRIETWSAMEDYWGWAPAERSA